MTRIISLLTTACAFLLLIACDTSTPAPSDADLSITREPGVINQQVRFDGKVIQLNTEDIVAVASNTELAANADARTVMNINEAFLSSEKEAQTLEVEFTMSDEPITEGMFIFGIESPQSKNLTVQMFDEEGFAMVAHNEFDITEGNNYKAMNVESLNNGTYTFRLKDQTGKELNRRVVVQQ